MLGPLAASVHAVGGAALASPQPALGQGPTTRHPYGVFAGIGACRDANHRYHHPFNEHVRKNLARVSAESDEGLLQGWLALDGQKQTYAAFGGVRDGTLRTGLESGSHDVEIMAGSPSARKR